MRICVCACWCACRTHKQKKVSSYAIHKEPFTGTQKIIKRCNPQRTLCKHTKNIKVCHPQRTVYRLPACPSPPRQRSASAEICGHNYQRVDGLLPPPREHARLALARPRPYPQAGRVHVPIAGDHVLFARLMRGGARPENPGGRRLRRTLRFVPILTRT